MQFSSKWREKRKKIGNFNSCKICMEVFIISYFNIFYYWFKKYFNRIIPYGHSGLLSQIRSLINIRYMCFPFLPET